MLTDEMHMSCECCDPATHVHRKDVGRVYAGEVYAAMRCRLCLCFVVMLYGNEWAHYRSFVPLTDTA